MDSFSSYHINKGGDTHSLKIKSNRITSVGEIEAGKCLKEENAAWGTTSNICILDSDRQILGN